MSSISSELLIAISQVVVYATFLTALSLRFAFGFGIFIGFWWFMLSACLEDGGSEIGLDGILGCGFSGVFVVYLWEDRERLGVGEKEGSLREREGGEGRNEILEKERNRGTLGATPAASHPFQRTSNRLVH